jgi:hypothetical protein
MNEGFSKQNTLLSENLSSSLQKAQTLHIDRTLYSSDVEAKAQVFSSFDSSPLLMTYLGHGAEDRWSNDILRTSDVSSLNNQRLPIVAALNCLNSYYYDADPSYKGLGEELVAHPEGGAIAFWGSTSLTHPGAQISLYQSFQSQLSAAIAQAPHDVRLGSLILRAKSSLSHNAFSKESVQSYTLIGDPAMKLPTTAFQGDSRTNQAPSSRNNDNGGGGGGCGLVQGPPGSGPQVSSILLLFALMFLPFTVLVGLRHLHALD